MTQYEHEIEIESPIEHVFEWSTDPANWQRTQPAMVDYEVLDEHDTELRLRLTYRMLGRTVTSETVTEFDESAGRIISSDEGGDMAGTVEYHFEETDDGTLVRFVGDFEAGDGIFDRALRPVLRRYMDRQFANSLRTMKELIEAEQATEEPAVAEH